MEPPRWGQPLPRPPPPPPPQQPKRPSNQFLCFQLRRPPSPFSSNSHPSDPSSPKVSCIGQVRVKSSRRRKRRSARNKLRGLKPGEESSTSGAFRSRSLRRSEHSWSWVHLPFGCACVALRRLVASVFCGLWRCGGGRWRSRCCCCTCSCEVCGEERLGSGRGGGGGDVVATAEESGKGWGLRELEMVADKLEKGRLLVGRRGGDDDDDEEEEEEDEDDGINVEDIDEDKVLARKNALLLMRCRSDPTKVSALAACFVDSGANEGDAEEDGDGDLVGIGSDLKEEEEEMGAAALAAEVAVLEEVCELEGDDVGKEEEFDKVVDGMERSAVGVGLQAVKEPQIEIVYTEQEHGFGTLVSSAKLPLHGGGKVWDSLRPTVQVEDEKEEEGDGMARRQIREAKDVAEKRNGRRDADDQTEMVARRHSSASAEKEERKPWLSKDMEGSRRHSFSSEKDAFPSKWLSSNREGRRPSFSMEKDAPQAPPRVEPPQLVKLLQAEKASVVTEKVEVPKAREEVQKRNDLPDCLLLMMYEPKLSMEVSRETWVCTTDFLRWQPRHWRRVKEKSGEGDLGVDRVGEEVEEVKGGSVRQCEKDEPPHMVLEEAPSGPFVLTRCKSEPARPWAGTGSQKGCFWKSRYEPTAAGHVGFLAAAK